MTSEEHARETIDGLLTKAGCLPSAWLALVPFLPSHDRHRRAIDIPRILPIAGNDVLPPEGAPPRQQTITFIANNRLAKAKVT